ncbi:MAG: hypothetical protein FWH26_00565 [Oscillospiraceae bacterium]|nr:hypothetical protein [Oscillospiraceae bacterium]
MLDQWIRGALQEAARRCRLTLELCLLLPKGWQAEGEPLAILAQRSEQDE